MLKFYARDYGARPSGTALFHFYIQVVQICLLRQVLAGRLEIEPWPANPCNVILTSFILSQRRVSSISNFNKK